MNCKKCDNEQTNNKEGFCTPCKNNILADFQLLSMTLSLEDKNLILSNLPNETEWVLPIELIKELRKYLQNKDKNKMTPNEITLTDWLIRATNEN